MGRTILKRLHLKCSLYTQGRNQEGGLNETDEFGTGQHLGGLDRLTQGRGDGGGSRD